MCIFSQLVEHVAGTKIFARLQGGEQLLAYEMEFASAGELAMVLPLPVEPGLGEAGARFIDLSAYPNFFEELSRLFPVSRAISGGFDMQASRAPMLAVQQVGDFEASYVPTIADFARLDPRFRLPERVWDELPQYRDFGFAVFKLRGKKRGLLERIGVGRAEVEQKKVHPMAFAFRTRHGGVGFYPTVHVHDGKVHETARFDHELYWQGEEPGGGGSWEKGSGDVNQSQIERSGGLLAEGTACFRLKLVGERPNEDVKVKE